jgi:FixJ family two-component response regulator
MSATPPLVFIVDDDEAVRMATRLLARSFGWNARAFGSARELLDALPQGHPDCLLLDLNMPEMNGVELQLVLAARGILIPVVVITGQKDSPLAARSRAAGARAMLPKPFVDEELKRSVESVLQS